MPEQDKRYKFFIFSDESGSWHDPDDIYVRAWVVVSDKVYTENLSIKVDEIASFMNSNELKWSGFSNSEKYFHEFDNISFRIFITISSPADINWEKKYKVTRNFEASIATFDFGEVDDALVSYLKERLYKDIKNALFLHYYEKLHIENAKNGIERAIVREEYDLIYRIDPPQMSQKGWKDILCKINNGNNVNLEFPKSIKTQGIQFADLIAGAFRSFIVQDKNKDSAQMFLKIIKPKMIYSEGNPNPNLIMYGEIRKEVEKRVREFWRV